MKNRSMICEIQKRLLPTAVALIFLPGALANCAHAQTVDLSTDEAVIAQLQKRVDAKRAESGATGDSNLDAKIKGSSRLDARSVCIRRLKESAKVIIVGFFRTDSGCHLDGAFINSRYFDKEDTAVLSNNALDALGWAKANQQRREQLVKLWVEKGLLAFYTVLYQKAEELNNFGFQPPQVVSTEHGEIKITLWFQLPSGMRNEKGFQHVEYRFARDGSLSGGSTLNAVVTEK